MGILGSPIISTFCFCPYFGLHGYLTIYIYIYVCHFSTGLIYMKDSWITVQPLLRYGSLIVICYHYYTVRYLLRKALQCVAKSKAESKICFN